MSNLGFNFNKYLGGNLYEDLMSKYALEDSKTILLNEKKVINKIKTKNNKSANFKRLGNKRLKNLIRQLKLLQNLSNKNNYKYSYEEFNIILSSLKKSFKKEMVNFKKT